MTLEINTEIINRLGYYIVNGIQFTSKVDALIYATTVKSRVQWEFNSSTFRRVPWEINPTETLGEIYKRRALQLREKYDYLVLNYSGGADSQNILDAFLDNNIKLDEIIVRWAVTGEKGLYVPSNVSRATNYHSEWDLTALPEMKRLSLSHPEIKIQFYDYTDDALKFYNDNDPWFQMLSGAQFGPSHISRYATGLDRYQDMFVEKGLRGCQIFGTDKPRIMFDNNTFYTYFLDIIGGTTRHLYRYNDEYNPLELFYWTPDMPEIVHKQAHVVMEFFKKNRNLIPVIMKSNMLDYTMRNTLETIVRSLVYPTWNHSKFQAPKPTSVFYCEYDDWFFKNAESGAMDNRPLQIWKAALDHVTKNIDKKWFNIDERGREDGFVGMLSPMYKIGTLDNE